MARKYGVYQRRDITIVEIAANQCLIMACDSCGSIGEKRHDALQVSSRIVGAYTARVGIMEVLATGADVVSISNAVCCEMNPTGLRIIEGIKHEMQKAGIDDAVLNGSTEENFLTNMTAIGISVVGIADKNALKFNPCTDGDLIILMGQPLMGDELLECEGCNTATYKDIKLLLENEQVREIVPVGSKGIAYEAMNLAGLHGLHFKAITSGIDMNRSAGPATCMIAAVASTWKPSAIDFKVIGMLKDHA